jgi:hypothetical protein
VPRPHTLADFQNEEPGNLVEWRIVHNQWAADHDQPAYFVYRMCQVRDRTITEYLQTDGRVAGSCAHGHFWNWAEIGMALILNQGLEQGGGHVAFYEPSHHTWLQHQQNPEPETSDTPTP